MSIDLQQHKYVRELKQNQTKAERKFKRFLLRCLKDNFPTLGFCTQVPIRHDRGFYILDFYIGRLKMAFEIDGEYHWQSNQLDKDLKRDAFLQKERYIKVYHIPNKDILRGGKRHKALQENLIIWIKNRIETCEWIKRKKMANVRLEPLSSF